MSLFVYVLTDIVHLIKILVLCDMFFSLQRRDIEHKGIVLMVAGIIMSGTSAFIYYFNNDEIETVIYIVAIVFLIYLLYVERLMFVFAVTLWMTVALFLIDTMNSSLFDISMDLLGVDAADFTNLCVSLISLLIVYVVGKIYRKNATAGMHSIGVANMICYTILLAVDGIVVTVVRHMNSRLNLDSHKSVYLIAVVLVIIGIFVQLVAVILLFMQRNVYKEKKLLTEKYLEEQKNHYEYLEKREQETKKFRHDFRSHLEMISFLAKNHEYDKIDSYLEQMNIRIDELGNNVTVQNGTVDAILNQYYARAMQQGIHMEVKGRLPGDCEIDAYDLCTIFSNVLSNAMEACVDTEEKYMSVECRYNERNIIIVAKNSFDSEGKKEGTWLKSRKENVNYHGFGLENMKDSINKYHGLHEITAENNIFTLTIIFNNMRKNEYESINSR